MNQGIDGNFVLRVRDMVFKATFNNISVISWWSVLLVEESRVPGENHIPTIRPILSWGLKGYGV